MEESSMEVTVTITLGKEAGEINGERHTYRMVDPVTAEAVVAMVDTVVRRHLSQKTLEEALGAPSKTMKKVER
jgi:hypothetical protein